MTSDDPDDVLHRDLARGAVGGVLAGLAGLGAACALLAAHVDAHITLDRSDVAFALGWGLALAAAWTVGAAAGRWRVVAGVVAIGLLAPLTSLGGEFARGFQAHGAVAAATLDAVEGERAPIVRELLLRAAGGALVLGGLLVARRREAGAAWELAASLGGALAGTALLGMAFVDAQVDWLDLGYVAVAPYAAQVVAVAVALPLGMRAVDLVLGRRDRARERTGPRRPRPRPRAGGGVALGLVALGWVAVVSGEDESGGEAAVRLLPWPRDAEALRRLADLVVHGAPGAAAPRYLERLGPSRVDHGYAYRLMRHLWAYEAASRAARRGDTQALYVAARHGLELHAASAVGFADGPRVIAIAPPRAEVLDWLRTAARAGEARAAVDLMKAARDDAERDEGRRLISSVTSWDDEGALLTAGHALAEVAPPAAGASDAERAHLVAALRSLALHGRTTARAWGSWVDPATPPAFDAARLLIDLAPRPERTRWIALVAARDAEGLTAWVAQAGPSAYDLVLPWLAGGAPGDLAVLPVRIDPLVAWPSGAGEGVAMRRVLAAARSSVRAGRTDEAWSLLADLSREHPEALAPRLARALTLVEHEARRGHVLGWHLQRAVALAGGIGEEPELSDLLATGAALELWKALTLPRDARVRQVVLGSLATLEVACLLTPGDLRRRIGRARLALTARALGFRVVSFGRQAPTYLRRIRDQLAEQRRSRDPFEEAMRRQRRRR